MPGKCTSKFLEERCLNITDSSKRHPKPSCKFSYGTAGFRTRADDLDSVMFRMGLLAVLRSKAKNGSTIGVMVTASHNPIQDNGVKLIDPMGEMLHASWEEHATRLANASDDEVCSCLQNIADKENITLTTEGQVFVARDTRPSGIGFTKAVEESVKLLNANFKDFGLLTTPQLHYIVRCTNTHNAYGEPTEDGYYKKLSNAFQKLRGMGSGDKHRIKLDAANGVGAEKVRKIQSHISKELLDIDIHNDGSSGILNEKCGADFVKVQQGAPKGFSSEDKDCCVAFDGDGDRVVFFYHDDDGKFNLLDGDKIAVLIAAFLKEKLDVAGIILPKGIGVVQTAYANGSATLFLEHFMKVPVACVNVGVKHLHKKAEEYDLGVYFEANGHGTVLFSDTAEKMIREMAKSGNGKAKDAAVALTAFMDLTNQTVGDAISDMLLVDIILSEKNWTCADWNKCYKDLPNRQLKVQVEDRTVIKTYDAERKVSSPPTLQEKIDQLCSQFNKARSFVRPSGTEDIVRVYAEAETQELADFVAASASAFVYDLCGGQGERPKVPEIV